MEYHLAIQNQTTVHRWLTPVITATWKTETGRTMVSGQAREKNCTRVHLLRKKLGMVACPATAGSVKYEDHSPSWSVQKGRPYYLQNNQNRKGWRHGPVAELPPSKHKAQSSNPSITKKKKKKKDCKLQWDNI
jgi:hypothetical protein